MMRLAIPCEGQRLAAHFGRAAQFVFFDADPSTRKITSAQTMGAPPHEPGILPGWLAKRGAKVILASGMGARARALLGREGIEVRVAVTADNARQAAEAYLAGELNTGANPCDHEKR